MRPRLRQPTLRRYKQRGSALVITLILIGVLAMAVGTALLAVQNLSRSVNDKISYEQCYHTAMSGIEMTAGWIRFPDKAATHINSTVGTKITGLTSCTLDMSKAIVASAGDGYALASTLTPSTIITNYYNGKNGFTADGNNLADGRRVLYNIPDRNGATDANEKLIVFKNDATGTSTADNLFVPASSDVNTFVRRARITTPFATDNLRNVSLIVESEAVTQGAGVPKSRVVRERMLIYPPADGAALLNVSAMIISGAPITVQGTSSLNVHWGPVWGRGDIDLLDIGPIVPGTTIIDGVSYNTLTLDAGNKFYGAGINYGADGDEKWLSWRTAGLLYNKNGDNRVPVFPDIGGIQVTDFFAQLLNGTFVGYVSDTMYLTDYYVSHGVGGNPTTIANGTYLYDPAQSNVYPLGNGAFVQNWPAIATSVDNFTSNTMDYNFWKSFAQTPKGYYLRPVLDDKGDVSGFVNGVGQTWYVANHLPTLSSSGATVLTSLGDISMNYLVPANHNPYALADVTLFVDTPEGTKTGTKLPYVLNSSDAFFWKGLLYLNGNLTTKGGGAFPDIWMRNPDEWDAAKGDDTLELATHGRAVAGCFMDGVLFVTGILSREGNATLYGTLSAVGGYDGGGGPDIYYNTRNRDPGLFSSSPSTYRVISGPIEELNGWPG